MAKYLFIVPPFSGHINPTLGVGLELLSKNHQVGWLTIDPSLKKKIPVGGNFLLLEFPMNDSQKEKVERELAELAKKSVYGLDSLKFLYDDVLIPMNTNMLQGVIDVIDSYNPDIIINDHQMFVGATAAILKNIPYATSVTAPAAIKEDGALPNVHKWESEQIISFQKQAGLNLDERLDCSSRLTLVYTSSDFFGANNLPVNYQFVGPIINRRPLDSDVNLNLNFEKIKNKGEKKNILVSIGTTFDHTQKKKFFDKVVEAFADNNLFNVILISHPELFQEIPQNFMIYEFIPQLELMPYMDVVICHAGHNTVCETLYNAIPLVVLPVAYDQSFVASCVTNSGCGIRLNFNRFKASQLKDAVQMVFDQKEYSEQANKIKNSFLKAGGAKRAAELLENLIKVNNR